MKSIKPNKILLSLGLSALSTMAFAESNAPIKVETAAQAKGSDNDFQTGSIASLAKMNKSDRYMVTLKETATLRATSYSGNSGGTPVFNANGEINEAIAAEFVRSIGGVYIKTIPSHNIVVVKLNKFTKGKMSANSNVESVADDPIRYLMAQSTPYGIPMVQATQLSQSDTSARKVCVIDTGYNAGHPDLPTGSGTANNNQVGLWYNDGNGHGTHVAGTISAVSNNEGVVGVYPGVDIHAVKIFNDNGDWTFASDLISGIQQCKDAGSNVVNMSLGGGSSSTTESNAMQGFNDDGIMLVAAAGNDGNSSFSYPASYDSVISVAAVGSNESRASYSQYNSQVEIAGPGSSVESTWPVNTYNTISGTSMATPHVAGAAALVWSFFPQCSDDQIRSALNTTAKDKGSSGRDTLYGYGIVQAKDAYDYININGCSGSGGGNGGDNGGGSGVEPVSGQVTGLSDNSGWTRYTWTIPGGVSSMTVQISGGSGDADLYMRYGAQPNTSTYDCRPYKNGNNEVCTFNAPASGTWHIGIRAYSAYSGVTLDYNYD